MVAEHVSQVDGFFRLDEDFYEQAIIEHLEGLGYKYLHGPDAARTHEDRYDDVFLPGVVGESLRRVNPGLPGEAVDEAVAVLMDTVADAAPLEARNERFTGYLQSGVDVHYATRDGKAHDDNVRLVDFEDVERNTFHVVNQWTFWEREHKRTDVMVFLNGIPVVVFELKSPSRQATGASDAYLQLRNYLKAIPSLFVPNVFLVMSDMARTRVGTITAPEERFDEWKSVDGDYSRNSTGFTTMLDGMLRRDRLVDIIRNFVCFNDQDGRVVKILAGYHQYFGVHKAADRAVEAMRGDGRIGVMWHTQGSGKSLSMVFLAHLLQERMDSPTIVAVVDRGELDGQLFGQFARCARFLRQTPVQAQSRKDLASLLRGRKANGIIFTTLQKFEEADEPLCDRSNVVVMVDEAHRSQYGLTETIRQDGSMTLGMARKMRDALPNASYIGFTGTPIELDGRNTQEVFGGYIDVYDMTQAVEDGRTVPVYYESRVVSLGLQPAELEQLDAAYQRFEDEHDEDTARRSKQEMGGLDALLGAPKTIDALCRDIIAHYEGSRADLLTGKAMIVAYSRPVAIRIYRRLVELRPQWGEDGTLGVVMTATNQDPEDWYEITHGAPKGAGSDLSGHLQDMERRFKDDRGPLKIVIVVDMLLTGFDVPSLATMYVYKPMKGHNLMQAIARVNRVYPGKQGGLIVDYVGIATALRHAMKAYTGRDQKNYGDPDIATTAYPRFQENLAACRDDLHGFDYQGIFTASSREQVALLIARGTDWLMDVSHDEKRESFLKHAQLLGMAESLCKSMVPKRDQHEAAFLQTLRVQVMRLTGQAGHGGGTMSYEAFNRQVAAMLEQTVESSGVIQLIDQGEAEISLFDESFLRQVAALDERNIARKLLERLLKEQIRRYGRRSIVKSERFSQMLTQTLNAYNNGMLTNEQVIKDLLDMAREMMNAREEGEKLGLSEEELAFYDALTQPQAVKDFYTNEQLVAMTRELTDSLRRNATVDWQEKTTARAAMRRAVKHLLRKYKYPPEGQQEALDTVLRQCEQWADTQEF